ncbi:unnamed protein product [Diplocarpon coronariae]
MQSSFTRVSHRLTRPTVPLSRLYSNRSHILRLHDTDQTHDPCAGQPAHRVFSSLRITALRCAQVQQEDCLNSRSPSLFPEDHALSSRSWKRVCSSQESIDVCIGLAEMRLHPLSCCGQLIGSAE